MIRDAARLERMFGRSCQWTGAVFKHFVKARKALRRRGEERREGCQWTEKTREYWNSQLVSLKSVHVFALSLKNFSSLDHASISGALSLLARRGVCGRLLSNSIGVALSRLGESKQGH
jgi:hypothetical protein